MRHSPEEIMVNLSELFVGFRSVLIIPTPTSDDSVQRKDFGVYGVLMSGRVSNSFDFITNV